MEEMYKKRIGELETEIALYKLNEKVMERDYLRMKDLLVKTTLLSGIRYDTKEYKEIVQMVGIQHIVLYKINHGITMSDEEKKYVTDIIKQS